MIEPAPRGTVRPEPVDPAILPANSMAPIGALGPGATDPAAIDRVLGRAEFGVTAQSRARAAEIGLEAYVDAMLDAASGEFDASVESEARSILDAAAADPSDVFAHRLAVPEWMLYLMTRTSQPFRERMALFWHDHFAVSNRMFEPDKRHMFVSYIDALRTRGLGSFRALVLEMARSDAMLHWLDGTSNVVEAPNENFAREFFELFTVGEGNGYDETDVREAARAFTGYRLVMAADGVLRHAFDADRKDTGTKTLFGGAVEIVGNGTVGDDYAEVVEATFEHLDVARWLARKLVVEFVTVSPSDVLVDNVREVVLRHDFELRPILRTLLLSQALHARDRELVRMPIVFGVGLIRATGLQVRDRTLREGLTALGQLPSEPPTVFGWRQGLAWNSEGALVDRAGFVRLLIMERPWQSANGVQLALPPSDPTVSDAEVAVDHFAGLLQVRLTDEGRSTLVEYMNRSANPFTGEAEADPFDLDDTRDVDERVRGLIYILANHPDASTL